MQIGRRRAGDTDTVNPVADLAITNTDGAASVNAGGTTTYTVRVTNNGPSSATGAILSDIAATGLSKTGVLCSATPGQCVTPPTVGQLEGGSFALPALARTLDLASGNNSAGDTDTVTPVADLAITKSDGVANVLVGGTTTYKVR